MPPKSIIKGFDKKNILWHIKLTKTNLNTKRTQANAILTTFCRPKI